MNNNNTKARNPNTRFVSARGKSLYARVQTPDTRFDANGVFHVDLLVEPSLAQPMIDIMEDILDDFYANNKDISTALAKGRTVNRAPVFEQMSDGTYRFRFKQKAKITAKDGAVYDKHVAVFDSKLQPLTKEIGNGSTIKVSYTCSPYYTPSTRTAGVSLRLIGVQVLDLVEFGDVDCGFTVEEGFTADSTPNECEAAGFTPDHAEHSAIDADEDVPF